MAKNTKNNNGFTLLELLLVVGVLVAIGFLVFSFVGFNQTSKLDTTTDGILELATEARGNSVAGEQFMKWGVSATNPSGTDPSYAVLFSCINDNCDPALGERKEIRSVFLQDPVVFNVPLDGATTDIIFRQRSGDLESGVYRRFVLSLASDPEQIRTIEFFATGLIEAQKGLATPPGFVFGDDFETCDFSKWSETPFIEGGNTLEVNAAAALGGACGLHVLTGTSNDDARPLQAFTPAFPSLYFRSSIRLLALPQGSNPHNFMMFENLPKDNVLFGLGVDPNGGNGLLPMELTWWTPSTNWGNTNFVISPNTTYCIEAFVDRPSGTPYASVSGETFSADFGSMSVGHDAYVNVFDAYIDNVELNSLQSIGC